MLLSCVCLVFASSLLVFVVAEEGEGEGRVMFVVGTSLESVGVVEGRVWL